MSDEMSAYEVHLPHDVLREQEGKSEAEKDPVWIKLNVTFWEEFLSKLKGPRLSVFLCVALHINEKFKARPSIAKISEETGYERKAVMRAVQWLEAEGLLSVERFKAGPKQVGRKANRYKVLEFASYGKKHSPSKGPRSIYHGPSEVANHSPLENQTMVPLEGHEEEPSEAEPIKKNHQQQMMKPDNLISDLCSYGFKKVYANKLTQRYPQKMIEDTIEVAKGKDLENPAGWIVAVLENGGAKPIRVPDLDYAGDDFWD